MIYASVKYFLKIFSVKSGSQGDMFIIKAPDFIAQLFSSSKNSTRDIPQGVYEMTCFDHRT